MHSYDPMRLLTQFHEAADFPDYDDLNVSERQAAVALRASLIAEEAKEVLNALGFEVEMTLTPNDALREPLPAIAKELADLKVVTYGTDLFFGIPAEAVFNEVMDSNMSKVGPDGKVIRREDGKILKGPHYRPADVWSILRAA